MIDMLLYEILLNIIIAWLMTWIDLNFNPLNNI